MYYTANPDLDAAMYNDDQQAKADYIEQQKAAAYEIALKEIKEVTASQWFDSQADSVLIDALECDDDTREAFSELMTCAQAIKLHEAMALHHAELCYTDILQPLPPERVRGLLMGGEHQADSI